MKNSRLKLATIGIAAAFLWLPLLEMWFNFIPLASIAENRVRNARPLISVQALLANDGKFQDQFEKYYNDNFGFRDLFIRIYNQLNYSLFRYSDKIYFGKDGWLFYRSVVDVEQYRNDNTPDAALAHSYRQLAYMASFLKKKGIRLIVAPMPLKNAVYPEFLPADAPRRGPDNALQRLRSHLQTRTDLYFFDVLPMMLELKKTRAVFHRTDFHWNDPTAAIVGRELIDVIGRMEHHPDVWKHPLVVEQRVEGGGQAAFVPMLFPVKEKMDFVKVNWVETFRKIDVPPFSDVWESTDNRQYKLPPTVIYGDSFSDGFLRAGYCLYFKKLYKMRPWQIGMTQVLNSIPADTKYFILESIEDVPLEVLMLGLPEQEIPGHEAPPTPNKPK